MAKSVAYYWWCILLSRLIGSSCLCVSMCLGVAQATPLSECLSFAKQDIALIVNADDIGMHPDLDRAVFKLIDAGQIQDISIMAPTPHFAEAAKMAKERNMAVGVHLTLTNEWQAKQGWGAVLPAKEVPSLYNSQGRLWANTEDLAKNANLAEVKKELKAQIAKVQAAGLKITHLDAHMLFWGASRQLFEIYLNLGKETGIPVVMQLFNRSVTEQMKINKGIQREESIMTPDSYSMHYNPSQRQRGIAYQGYSEFIDSLPAGVHSLAIHPAEDSPSARYAIEDLVLRLSDFAAWQDPQLQQKIKEKGIKKISYAPLYALQEKIKLSQKNNCLLQTSE